MSACKKPAKKAPLVSSPSPAGAISISDSALTPALVRDRSGDGRAKRMADEMRLAHALLDHDGARRLDQRAEGRLLAERRETVAGEVDRQRRARLGQQALHRPPAVEVGAEAVQEHDRRARAALEPEPMDVRRSPRGRSALLDVAQLDSPARA